MRRDCGAAAVEFALLFPVFAMVCVGTITFGFAFESWINVTQAARETARFAATYPKQDPATSIDSWLNDVGQVAAQNASINLATADPNTFFICVMFINKDNPSAPASKRATWGSLSSPPASGSCTGSTVADNRVEVLIQKRATVNWIGGLGNFKVGGQNTSLFEPEQTP